LLRYGWFEQIRKNNNYNFILTAHHGDDNIETVLMNFFRGTGIKGIRGIEAKNVFIVRPLLFARRKELEDFMTESQLQFVTDYTNEQDDYSRNFFRHQVIPMVEKTFPGVQDNLLSNISRFRDVGILYQQAIDLHKKKLLEYRGNEVHIAVLKLKNRHPLHTIVYEIIKIFGFTAHQAPDVVALLDSETGKYVSSSTHRVIRNRKWLIIAPLEAREAGTIVIEEGDKEVTTGRFQLQFFMVQPGSKLPSLSTIACVDATEIKFPLLLRKWKQGDYFYPLGMPKKKKVSRFFIDQKLSKTEKENIWVLEMDKKIVWVIGHRIDDRFKITAKTKEVLKITCHYLPN
jgi:tRNA(Ile)-lysidine synthase